MFPAATAIMATMDSDGNIEDQARPLVTRIPPPAARESEEAVAGYIEQALAAFYGRDLGERRRRDGDGLRVDFTYDHTEPGVALEVTGLVVPELAALSSELVKLEEDLHALAVREGLGSWTIGIGSGSDLRPLREPLIRLMQSEASRDGTATYSAEAAPPTGPPRAA